MTKRPEQFSHLVGLVDLSALAKKRVVIVGVGAVGSQLAKGLADHAVGCIRMVDHDTFTIKNRGRHALPRKYAEDSRPWNKAEAMAAYLRGEVRGINSESIQRKVDESLSDSELDRWLADADLIVAATDEREAQRRIGRRALALDISAVVPGLYEGRGGEVFVQRGPRRPCFFLLGRLAAS
jgi:molybdopterin-synthase adenylyltransferase